VTLEELHKLAEECGGLLIPDEADGPEVIFDIDAFEKFTDAVYRSGTVFGLDLAQRIADKVRVTNAKP
jgi:hypothetical protein